MPRADFPAHTKEIIAKRAAYRSIDIPSMNHYYRLFQNSSSFFQSIAVMHSQWEGLD